MNFLKPDVMSFSAVCPKDMLERLISYDHHSVRVNDEYGVLITYHLLMDADSMRIYVVMEHADKHPQIPMELQRIIDKLEFKQVVLT